MIFIFNKKSIFVCLFAYLVNLINCKVLITTSSKSYFVNKLEKLEDKIKINSLIYLHMSSQKFTNLGEINGDYNKISNKCVDDLCERINFSKKLEFLFFNVKDLKKKLKIVIYQYFDELFFPQQSIIAWLESSAYRDNIIINFSALKPGAKKIWKKSHLKNLFVLNYLNYFISLLGKILFLISNNLIILLYKKFKKIQKKNNINNKFLKNDNYKQNDVLFFPHNGVITFGHPPKDYFYSDKIESPFHPSKIIHLEYDNRVNVELEIDKIKKYFKVDFVNYKRFTNTHIPWLAAIRLIKEIFFTIKLFKFKNLASNLLYYSIILNLYIFFERNRNSLKNYKNAKIALVGYEILFPKSLSLALESLNIKTISITERFWTPYINNQTFVLDTLLSISDESSKIISNSDRFSLNKIFPVGQVRSDRFFDNVIIEKERERKKRVLVLDSHIADQKNEKFSLDLNWKNDIHFRNKILLLAESNPKIEFIFRGKNCNWFKNQEHYQVVSKVEKLSNVKVDADYSKDYWKSYHLCVSSDLIISRPTSLAEECASLGMDIIVVDCGINYKTYVSKFLPKLLREYYCTSYEQLNSMIKVWIEKEFILTNEKKNEIKKKIFSNLTDGKVKERIQKYLNEIYLEIN